MPLERFVAQRRANRGVEDIKEGESALLAIDEQGRALINGAIRKSSPNLVALNSADPDGIKTSFATSTSEVTLRAADYDGDEVSSGLLQVARNVTLTLAANAGSYNTDPILIFGVDAQGRSVSETVTPSSEDGGETLSSVNVFVGEVTIKIPAQQDTSGAFEVGVGTAVSINPPCDSLFVATAGTMVVALVDDFDHTMTIGSSENNFTIPYAVKSVHGITDADGIRPVYG